MNSTPKIQGGAAAAVANALESVPSTGASSAGREAARRTNSTKGRSTVRSRADWKPMPPKPNTKPPKPDHPPPGFEDRSKKTILPKRKSRKSIGHAAMEVLQAAEITAAHVPDEEEPFTDETPGSPAFLAPECVQDLGAKPRFDAYKADVWAVGCTVYCMLCGRVPLGFNAQSVPAMWEAIAMQKVDLPEHLSDDAKSFLTMVLEKDPSKRPSAKDLVDHPFLRNAPPLDWVRPRPVDSLPKVTSPLLELGRDAASGHTRPKKPFSSEEEQEEEPQEVVNPTDEKAVQDKALEKQEEEDLPTEGWLRKRGRIFKTWQIRYFAIHGGILYYFREPPSYLSAATPASLETDCIGLMPLAEVETVEVRPKPDKSHRFLVATPDRELFLRGDDDASSIKWMRSIRKAVEKERGKRIKYDEDFKQARRDLPPTKS